MMPAQNTAECSYLETLAVWRRWLLIATAQKKLQAGGERYTKS